MRPRLPSRPSERIEVIGALPPICCRQIAIFASMPSPSDGASPPGGDGRAALLLSYVSRSHIFLTLSNHYKAVYLVGASYARALVSPQLNTTLESMETFLWLLPPQRL